MEFTPLLQKDKRIFDSPSFTSYTINNGFTILLFFLAVYVLISYTDRIDHMDSLQLSTSSPSIVGLYLESPGYGSLDAMDKLPWTYIAEPFKEQTLNITSLTVELKPILDFEDDTKYSIVWTLNGIRQVGHFIKFTLSQVGTVVCSVKITNLLNDSSWSQTDTVSITYPLFEC